MIRLTVSLAKLLAALQVPEPCGTTVAAERDGDAFISKGTVRSRDDCVDL